MTCLTKDRPIRIPEDVQINLSDPAYAKAGERGSWTCIFTLRKDISPQSELLLYIHGGRNNTGVFAGAQTDYSNEADYVSLITQTGVKLPLTVIENTNNGLLRFNAPEEGLNKDDEIVMDLGGTEGILAPGLSLNNKFILIMEVPKVEHAEHKKDIKLSANSNNIILFGKALDNIIGACLSVMSSM
jgi:hypothetical protein